MVVLERLLHRGKRSGWQPEKRKACGCAFRPVGRHFGMLCQPKLSRIASRCAAPVRRTRVVMLCECRVGWLVRTVVLERLLHRGGRSGWQPENRKAYGCAFRPVGRHFGMLCQPILSRKASRCAAPVRRARVVMLCECRVVWLVRTVAQWYGGK